MTIAGAADDEVITLIGGRGGRRVRVVIHRAGQRKAVFSQSFAASRLSRISLGLGSGSQAVRVRGRLAASVVFRGTGSPTSA